MKTLLVTAVLVCSPAISLAQSQLAPNPGCPNAMPYCRSQTTNNINVMGFNDGILYGWEFASGGFQLYSSSTFNPENWVALGPAIAGSDTPIEIVFPAGHCSIYKYIYTNGKRILRANTSDWNFTDVGSSNIPYLPSDTDARVASFAAATQGSQTRLFYGNYNDHSVSPPDARIWISDNCGDSWVVALDTWDSSLGMGAQEIHAINVDPANPYNIYATIDTENLVPPNPWLGLWTSTQGGNTGSFQLASVQPTQNPPPPPVKPVPYVVGINFVFPRNSTTVFLETDGDPANNPPPNGGPSGPLLSWDTINGGQFLAPSPWPSVSPGTPVWAGSGLAINLTSDQNIFLITTAEGRNSSYREGIWYFVPPTYNTAILLEDLAPPINSLTFNNGTATATTIAPHGLQSTDTIMINGVTPACFNSSTNGVPITVTGPSTFTYWSPACFPCPNCSNPTGTGGYATKIGLNFIERTVEVTDTSTNITYLYSGNSRVVKPRTDALLATIIQILYENLLN